MEENRTRAHAKTFLGHPIGLAYLAFTEAWERFSFYGMSALMLLYMIQHLLTPAVAHTVLGFSAFRAGVETVTGHLSNQAFASQVLGLYMALVYFTPILGGWLADRWLGKRLTVISGAIMMAAGHLLMAFNVTFLVALLLMIAGSGCLKGNISAQVGHLYQPDDTTSRTRAFAIFSAAINFGGLAGPLLCGILAQELGWHVGFGAAGVMMLVALATYITGWKHLPADERVHLDDANAPLTAQDRRVVATLLLLILLAILPLAAYFQQFNGGLLFIDQVVNRTVFGWSIPAASFIALDGLFCILAVPPVIMLWKQLNKHGREPGDIQKIAIGFLVAAMANCLMIIPALRADAGESVSIAWPIAFFALNAVGFLYYWPTLLALFSRTAPRAVNSTMMGVLFLTLFAANLLVGTLASRQEGMTRAEFFLLHAALAFGPSLVVLLLVRLFDENLAPSARLRSGDERPQPPQTQRI